MRCFLLLPTLTAALLLGCGGSSRLTAPPDPAAPSLSVDRSTEHFGLGFADDRHVVIIGATFENWAALCATGAQTWDAWNLLTVTRPDGSLKATFKGEEMNVLVWTFPADACTESPDFAGTGRIVVTDSDVNLDGRGADATGQTVTGTVTDESGQRYHLVAVIRATVPVEFTSIDNFVFDQHVLKIQLTPIGG
jgi:hypothetical protein